MVNLPELHLRSFAIRVLPGLALLGVLIVASVPEQVAGRFAAIDARWLAPAAGLYLGSLVLRGIRLWFMVRS